MAATKEKCPTYPLVDVVRLAGSGPRFVTDRAADTAWDQLGMDRDAVFKTVGALHERDFYKTMPAEQFPDLHQDVYHAFAKPLRYPRGVLIYCKVQILNDRLTVISFKLKDD